MRKALCVVVLCFCLVGLSTSRAFADGGDDAGFWKSTNALVSDYPGGALAGFACFFSLFIPPSAILVCLGAGVIGVTYDNVNTELPA